MKGTKRARLNVVLFSLLIVSLFPTQSTGAVDTQSPSTFRIPVAIIASPPEEKYEVQELTDDVKKEVEELIDKGNYQEAIDKLIEKTGLDVSAIKGKPTYDSSITGEGETSMDREVKIGDKAFKTNGKADASWLYSTIIHENDHAKELRAGKITDVAELEVNATLIELENATQTGVIKSAKRVQDLKDYLNKYWSQLSDDKKKEYEERYNAVKDLKATP